MSKKATSARQALSDEYAELKDDLLALAERGADDKQESSPGREITSATFLLESRYGVIVRTDPDTSLPAATFTTTRPDRKGVDRTQRFLLGLTCEVITKDAAQQSENVGSRKRVVSEFETIKNAAQLFSATVEKAQDAGDKIQRKIDEDNYEFWPAVTATPTAGLAVVRHTPAASSGSRFEPVPVATFGKLMAIIEQTIDKALGAKLDKTNIICTHYAECQTTVGHDGVAVDSVMPRLSIAIEVKAKSGQSTYGSIRGAGGGLEILLRDGAATPEEAVTILAERVAQDAIDRERAQGTAILGSECPVILSSHAAGVLAHEVYGHTSEGDIICENRRSKTAKVPLKGRIGGSVSSHSALTIVDSGEPIMDLGGKELGYGWGSLAYDERGQPATRTALVTNGVMANFMSDERCFGEVVSGLKPEVAASIIEHGLSGNVRRERYDQPAQVRMTNTFILADPNGPKSLKDMCALVPKNKKGVYIKACSGGWVNTESGDFCLKGALGFLIENGILTDKPIKDVDLTGNISKFGDSIKAIGTIDTVTERFSGFCGKADQWVPVDGAAPLMYVENAKIGGGGSYYWADTLEEFLRQSAERRDGRREHVYVPALEDASGITEHDRLCLVTAVLPAAEEARLILGQGARPDYERDSNGGLVKAGLR